MHLDQILDGLEVSTSAFALCEVRGNGRFVLREEDKTSIHCVLAGSGVGWQVSGQGIDLLPHTVMVIPPGTEVAITCHRDGNWIDADPVCDSLPEDWVNLTIGDGDARIGLACAYVTAQHMQTSGLFDYLHEPMILDFADDQSFRTPFEMLLNEMAAPKPGTRALTAALMKQCLIALLRRQSEPNGDFSGPWLAAVTNPALGKAIAAILDKPAKPHTVSALAETAGMSRTAFSEQFKELTGRTPIDFLKEVRLRLATRLLTSTDLPVKTIAARVGFSSRSYFSSAFKTFAGVDPTNFRCEPVQFVPDLTGAMPEYPDT